MSIWARLRRRWKEHDEELATRELRRAAAEAGAPQPGHTGGALFDEPFEATEIVPGDDAPSGDIQ